MAKKRTTLRSKAGKKLYAVRDEAGKFEDIQSYKRAHASDIKRQSKAELDKKAGVKKSAAKKTVKKAAGAKKVKKATKKS